MKFLMVTSYITWIQSPVSFKNTVWNQQEQVLFNMILSNLILTNPLIQCLQDLTYLINEYIKSGYETILVSDTNHTMQKDQLPTQVQETPTSHKPKIKQLSTK